MIIVLAWIIAFNLISLLIYGGIHNFIIRQLFKSKRTIFSIHNQMPVFLITLALDGVRGIFYMIFSSIKLAQWIYSPLIALVSVMHINNEILLYLSFTYLYFWTQLIYFTIQIPRHFPTSYVKSFLYNLIAQCIAFFSAFVIMWGLARWLLMME